jgi:hypothetical protein
LSSDLINTDCFGIVITNTENKEMEKIAKKQVRVFGITKIILMEEKHEPATTKCE